MNYECVARSELVHDFLGKAFRPVESKGSTSAPVRQNRPSPISCTLYLILCISVAEVAEGWLLQAVGPYTSSGSLLFFDIFILLFVLLPPFYYFVYRPIRIYAQQVDAADQEIRFLSRQLLQASDHEKRAVARDIQDNFGQSLTLLQLSVESLKTTCVESCSEHKGEYDNIIDYIAQLGDMVRNVSTKLSPVQLDDLGLLPSIEWLIREAQGKGARFSVEFDADGLDERLPSEMEIVLYRVFQESLHNIVTHSGASQVRIKIEGTSNEVRLRISDNGCGFNSPLSVERPANSDGIGLLEMRERVESLGGEFNLSTAPGKGTMISTIIPFS